MRRTFDHKGVEYVNVADMCHCYRVTVNEYRKRIREGMNLQEALEYEESIKFPCKDPITGEYHKSMRSLAKAHGLLPETLRNRLYNLKWPLKKALIVKTKRWH